MQGAITPSDSGSSEHTLILHYRGSLKNAECSRRLQRESNTRAWAGQTARLRSRGAIVRIILAIAPFVCQMAASTAFEFSARTNCGALRDHRSVRRIHRGSVRSLRGSGKLDPCCDAG
jgi:hypothetical protein